MKKILILLLVSLFVPALSAQHIFKVTAESGLILRAGPGTNSAKLRKLPFGQAVDVLERTGIKTQIQDEGNTISGEWVKVSITGYPKPVASVREGYVFDGFLVSQSALIRELEEELGKFEVFKDLAVRHDRRQYHLRGDFFGDGVEDVAVMVQGADSSVKIAIINYGPQDSVRLLGGADDPFRIHDYAWAGIFEKVASGKVLWSNYVEDFRELEDVPDDEKVVLSYDAIFLHQEEACGGGFVFWQDGKFHWLQQE
ncbi:MAG: SH3 domain-containing protein [Bacteroidota bacterium]